MQLTTTDELPVEKLDNRERGSLVVLSASCATKLGWFARIKRRAATQFNFAGIVSGAVTDLHRVQSAN